MEPTTRWRRVQMKSMADGTEINQSRARKELKQSENDWELIPIANDSREVTNWEANGL